MLDQPTPGHSCASARAFDRDDRKTAAVADSAGGLKGMRMVRDFDEARALLRNRDARQAGFMADLVNGVSLTRTPILFQHGAEHRRQRSATARFFAPRVVTTTYRALMERTSDALIDRFKKNGSADLDELGLEMAVSIAAEIVGLTNSDHGGMARRLGTLVTGMPRGGSRVAKIYSLVRAQIRTLKFFLRDVRPAIASRREQRREDVISHLLDEGYSEREILTECLTYGAAGMVTTREFITMVGWHLLEDDALRERFLEGDEAAQIVILEEILRLEPVVGLLFRRIDTEADRIALDVRGANGDQTAMGECPHQLNPDRKTADKVGGAGLAFGDGEHRCPGSQVALQETAIFLDRLLRVADLRLKRKPDIGWNALVAGYELRGATLTCAREAA